MNQRHIPGHAGRSRCSAASEAEQHDADIPERSADDLATMACLGAGTRTVRKGCVDFEKCIACGTQVRWDLIDNRLFGFANGCPMSIAKGLG
jgi:hypothetical protein